LGSLAKLKEGYINLEARLEKLAQGVFAGLMKWVEKTQAKNTFKQFRTASARGFLYSQSKSLELV
jgi:hypothetical protein